MRRCSHGSARRGVTGLVFAATVAAIAILFASPDWLPIPCSSSGDDFDCSSVNPLLVGFVGIVVSLALLFIGFTRSDP